MLLRRKLALVSRTNNIGRLYGGIVLAIKQEQMFLDNQYLFFSQVVG